MNGRKYAFCAKKKIDMASPHFAHLLLLRAATRNKRQTAAVHRM